MRISGGPIIATHLRRPCAVGMTTGRLQVRSGTSRRGLAGASTHFCHPSPAALCRRDDDLKATGEEWNFPSRLGGKAGNARAEGCTSARRTLRCTFPGLCTLPCSFSE